MNFISLSCITDPPGSGPEMIFSDTDPDPAKSFGPDRIQIQIHNAYEHNENMVLFVFLHVNFCFLILLYFRENCALQMERVRENYNSQVRSVKVNIDHNDQDNKTLCIFACLLDFLKKLINISHKDDRFLFSSMFFERFFYFINV